MSDDFIQKTLKKIEEEKIAPKSKWQYFLREYSFWVFFSFSIIIGALATSTIIYLMLNHDWDEHVYLHESLFRDILVSAPYLWIIILVLFILAAFFEVKNTKTGYKYSAYRIVAISIVLSMVLGMVLFYCFFDLGIHDFLSNTVPVYNKLVCDEENVWNNIGSGLLDGEVTAIKSPDEFTLKDCNNKIWDVSYNKSQWLEKIPLRIGMKIKMVGAQTGDNAFSVKIIRPLEKIKPPLNMKRNKIIQPA